MELKGHCLSTIQQYLIQAGNYQWILKPWVKVRGVECLHNFIVPPHKMLITYKWIKSDCFIVEKPGSTTLISDQTEHYRTKQCHHVPPDGIQ